MSTTALVIEHLITGLQSSIWILLLVLTLFGWNWISLKLLQDLLPIITFIGLATVYPIGICVDEVADCIFTPWMKRIRDRRFKQEDMDPDDSEITIMSLLRKTDDEFLKTYFSYIRMRIRVSRSTSLNLVFILISAFLFTLTRLSHLKIYSLLMSTLIIVGIISIAISIWVWYKVSDTFSKQTIRAYKLSGK